MLKHLEGRLWQQFFTVGANTPVMTDEIDIPTEPRAAVDALATHLTATADRPVPPATNRWLGEAEAVARDLAERPADPDTVRERTGHVVRLLREAGDTEDERADEHVAAALKLADELVAELTDRDEGPG